MSDDVSFLSQLVRDSMESQAQEALSKTNEPELDIMRPLQVRIADLNAGRPLCSPASREAELLRVNKEDVSHILRLQEDANLGKVEARIGDTDDGDGKGVLYCELGIDNKFDDKSEDEGKNLVDSSIPCLTVGDET